MLTREQEQQVEQTLRETGNVKGLEYIHRLKNELRSKVDYIHEQDEIIDDYKHRVKVVERALLNMTKKYMLADGTARKITTTKDGRFLVGERMIALFAGDAIKQAEKELAEEIEE